LLRLERLLDGLYLLGNGRQHTFFQSIELVEATPGSYLTQTDKDSSHGLEIKRFVTVEHKHKTAELVAQCLYRLGFTGT
jgi:hypothetical protein